MTNDPDKELLQRTRRIETRLTQLMGHMGVETARQAPRFDAGTVGGGKPARVVLPSPHTSTKEMLSAIPDGWTGPVRLYIGGDAIGTFTPDRS